MTEYKNSKSDVQLEELLLLTEQMQEELDQKDRTIEELKVQLDESLTLNERLNSENRAGNIQALKNDLRKTKELLQSEKEKTHAAEIMTEECQDKLRQAEQERDYALSHQKKVEIPVEKPVLYQKCGNCNLTAYLKAKEKYDTQREKLAGRYKTKTAMYEALMFVAAMVGLDARATMDLDATIKGTNVSVEDVEMIISQIISIPLDDGVSFRVKRISEIMEEADYPGVRVSMETKFDGVITPLKIDISTGDVITPREIKYKFNLMLEDRTIEV